MLDEPRRTGMLSRRDVVLELVGHREPDYTIRLPYLPLPQGSNRARNMYAVAGIRKRFKDRCREEMTVQLLQQGWSKGQLPATKAEILVTFILPNNQARDSDNLQTGMKAVLDSLHPDRDNPDGVILDDRLQVIGFPLYDWRVEKGVSETVIEIWDQSPPDVPVGSTHTARLTQRVSSSKGGDHV